MLIMFFSMLSDEKDRRALFELYEQYQGMMQRIARSFFPDDPYAVDDVVQTAWLRVVENFSKFHEIPSEKKGGYLVIIVKNESLSLLRNRKREILTDEAQLIAIQKIIMISDSRLYETIPDNLPA